MQNTLKYETLGQIVEFQSVNQLLEQFKALGVNRAFFKRLAENDNSKQQIYVGGSFRDLERFPFGEVREFPHLSRPNMKAAVNLNWITPAQVERAPHAQLILYPKYPEVRLSGFLSGCSIAPSGNLQPVPKENRTREKTRFLIFAIGAENEVFAHLAVENSHIAKELDSKFPGEPTTGVFHDLEVATHDARSLVLEALRKIRAAGFHPSSRLDKSGASIPYKARNGGGYTLEALLGIKPNSKSEPDYLGWEIKAYGSDRVTLMTPEPTGGYYGLNGVEAFVRKYGYVKTIDRLDFNGVHKVGEEQIKTRLTMQLTGFDFASQKIVDVTGALALVDQQGNDAARWKFTDLLFHWNRKHALAAYVPYAKQEIPISYHYKSPILMAEGTDFPKFLAAMCSGTVIYDPACKVVGAGSGQPKSKARNQFRIAVKRLEVLYDSIVAEDL